MNIHKDIQSGKLQIMLKYIAIYIYSSFFRLFLASGIFTIHLSIKHDKCFLPPVSDKRVNFLDEYGIL